jgi:hypothetical protein
VPIVWSNCPFGGKRPWFLCPTINHERKCLGRVAVLYLGSGPYFACRKCHNLAYASQAEPIGQRGIQRARAIRMKIGGGENILDSFPVRPKGMHRRTYSRLQASYKRMRRTVVLLSPSLGPTPLSDMRSGTRRFCKDDLKDAMSREKRAPALDNAFSSGPCRP